MGASSLTNRVDDIPQELLDTVFAELPPEPVVAASNPGAIGMRRVLAGIALSSITLNILALNHILPAIGAVLLLLGFRNLHRENMWFQAAYLCSILRFGLLAPQLILNATIYAGYLHGDACRWLLIISCVIQAVLLFTFWMAIRQVQKKAGITEPCISGAALFVWYSLILAAVVVGFTGTFVAVFMLVAFVMIIRSLGILSKEMETSGYMITAAPVKISDSMLAGTIIGVLIGGIACGYLFFQSYNMEWQPVDLTAGTSQDIYSQLLSLGYPEEQLRDLSLQELELLEDADCVVVKRAERPLNSGVEKTEYFEGDTLIYTEYPDRELKLTHVAVRIAGDGSNGERWRVIHHFALADELQVNGTANLKLWPLETLDGWSGTEDLSGRLLCRQKDTDVTADYYAIGEKTYRTTDFFGQTHKNHTPMCDFSMPASATERRGYVAYTSEQTENGYLLSAWLNYTHQVGFLQYPVKTAGEYAQEDLHVHDYPFRTEQSAIQFYITDGIPEGLEEFENIE